MTTVDNRDILVQIKDLRTYFFLAEGVVRAVDGCDLDLTPRAKPWASWEKAAAERA
jgi:hypothetical protein